MTSRQRFVDYVRHGAPEPFVSLQIGTGAGFDVKLAGKEWISEGTLRDTIDAYERVGGEALINVGFGDLINHVPGLAWQESSAFGEEERVYRRHLETPYGDLDWELVERKRHGSTPTHYPLRFGDALDKAFWFVEQHQRAVPYVEQALAPLIAQVHPEYALSVQWPLQPFELFGLATVPDMVMFAMTDPERYRQLCDAILAVNVELAWAAVRAGADFLFLGGPGREMMSPELYEGFMVPDSQAITRAIHEAGGLVYTHICSPIEPFLSMGYYGRMGIDLFETLSPPPVGNVAELAAARARLPAEMCTRGNIGLDVLLNGTVEDVRRATLRVIEGTRGSKHMVAASDYLFYDIPLENVRAVVETAQAAGVSA